METREIKHQGESLYFCSTDGKKWIGVNHFPQTPQEEKTLEGLIDGAGSVRPVTFNPGLLDALERDQEIRTVYAGSVVT